VSSFTLDKVTYSTDLAVSADEMKRHLIVKNLTSDLALDLTDKIKEAIDRVEGMTRRSLMPASYRLVLDDWPADCVIPLDRFPVIGVTSVKYRRDTDGDWTPMTAGTDYKVDKWSKPGRILMLNTPSLYSDELSKVEIIFSSGHSSTSTVPPKAKQAVKLLVGTEFEERQDQIVKGMTKAEKLCRSIAIARF